VARKKDGRIIETCTTGIIYWEHDGAWLGYLQDYPDYWTQGTTLDELKENLKDVYRTSRAESFRGYARQTT
jgi:hypothetical protein